MSEILAIAARSMTDDMARLATISHNLANATTPGFRKDLVVSRPFRDYLQVDGPAGRQMLATTVPVHDTVVDHRAGSVRYTGGPLDVALDGPGFFELAAENGPLYTRAGNFQVDARGRLVSADGIPVAGDITLTSAQVRIDAQGRVWDDDRPAGQLRVVAFERAGELRKIGHGLFIAPTQTGTVTEEARVRQGFLENSNVVSLNEMVAVIETMRHFEASQKLIQSHDELLDRTIRTLGEF